MRTFFASCSISVSARAIVGILRNPLSFLAGGGGALFLLVRQPISLALGCGSLLCAGLLATLTTTFGRSRLHSRCICLLLLSFLK